MSVTHEDVRKVAQLARLRFDTEEMDRLVADLNQMLDYAAALEKLNTTDVAPTSHVLPVSNVFREDTPVASLSQVEALSNAPSSGFGHFRVPKVID
ncbi:MAG: Asp-tRNA(Asn)/Glu-tRNA(Gln) amidotransferase subunit GatC [Gemmatimonadota bacterium]|nr:Asp-tRNA(Asn)/Glu-tRNA(Gln) amidotransferase subunit GatC [Gemmatimonadota bacterium]